MKRILAWPWFEVALFAAALALRLVFLAQLAETPYIDERVLVADADYYDMRGREIAAGNLLGDAPAFLSPLYCLFVGQIYFLAGGGPFAVKLVQALLGAASCVLLCRASGRLFTRGIGQIAGLALALYGPHVYYGGLMLPAVLVVFLHLVLLEVVARPPSIRVAAMAGVLIGLAVLAKSNAVLLLGAIAVGWWLTREPGPPRGYIRCVVALCLGAALAVLPVVVANYRLSGVFPVVTTTGGSNLLKGNGPTATGTHAFLPLGAQFTGLRAHLDHRVDGHQAVRQSRKLSAQALRQIVGHPVRAASLFGKKLVLLLNARELGIRDHYAFARARIPLLGLPLLHFWAVVPLGLAGAILSLSRWRRLVALYAVLVVQVVSFILVFVLARYRLVAVACLMPFAAWLIVDLVDRFRRGEWNAIVRTLALVAGFAVLAAWPLREFPVERGLADQYRFLGTAAAARGEDELAAEHYQAALGSSWQDDRRADALQARTELDLATAESRTGRVDAARRRLESLVPRLERARATGMAAEARALLDSLVRDTAPRDP